MPTTPLRLIDMTCWALIGALFLCLPTASSTADAYFFAASARWDTDLWQSHHLLWNPLLRGIWLLVDALFPGADVLATAKAFNALGALLGLGVLNRLLGSGARLHPLTLLCAASFGFARFATEGEAYVWPLAISLLGMHVAARSKTPRDGRWVAAGLLAALAVLLHQIQIGWGLAMLLFAWQHGRWQATLRVAAPALLVLFAYALAAQAVNLPLADLVLGEFATGGVKMAAALPVHQLEAIALVRTWVQVHGYMAYLPAFYQDHLLAGGAVVCIGLSLGWLANQSQKSMAKPTIPPLVGWVVAGWLLLVSTLSQGNAEFLCGLPFAVALGLANWSLITRPAVGWVAGGLLAYNLMAGLVPLALAPLHPYQALANLARQHPRWYFYTAHGLEAGWAYHLAYGVPPQNIRHQQWLKSADHKYSYNGQFLPVRNTMLIEHDSRTQLTSRESLLEVQTPVHLHNSTTIQLPVLGGVVSYEIAVQGKGSK